MQNLVDYSPWNWSADQLLRGNKFIFVKEESNHTSSVHGEFAWLLLFLQTLKHLSSHETKEESLIGHVKLLALKHSRGHYVAIGKKHGIDIEKLERTGFLSLHAIESSQSLEIKEDFWQKITTGFCLSTRERNNTTDNNDDNKSIETSVRVSLFIDSLDVLELIAPSPAEGRLFIAKICQSMYTNGSIAQLTVFASSSSSISMAELREDNFISNFPTLTNYCGYRADTTICVSPLSSGYSFDIGGQLLVSFNGDSRNTHYVYKALDTGVKCSKLSGIS